EAMAGLLMDPAAASRQRLFLLDTMDQCNAKTFPESWPAALRGQLASKDNNVRARVISLVRARQLAGLDPELERIARDSTESRDLRVAALAVVLSRRQALNDGDFRFLLELLQPATDADLRQTAAQILGRAKLSDPQLRILAGQYLPQADP